MTPDRRPCLCKGSYLCPRHTIAHLELSVLARNIEMPDDMWLKALHRLMADDLHRLLEGAS